MPEKGKTSKKGKAAETEISPSRSVSACSRNIIMAYVSVPKDLTKVKNKVILNLTKRQVICLTAAAAIGLPFYFFTQGYIGTSNATSCMVLLMLPAFLFATYEKDGMPLEKILLNVIRVKLSRPAVRRYEVENLYEPKKDAAGLKIQKKGEGKHAAKKGYTS